MFNLTTGHGATCQLGVGTTGDGGHRFSKPHVATAWSCDANAPVSSIAADTSGDVFLYGPGLEISHDRGRSWRSTRPGGSVLAMSVVGRSSWLVAARCTGHGSKPDSCPILISVSANGGRSWQPAPAQPAGAAVPGFGHRVAGTAELVRTSSSSAYLLGAPAVNNRGRADLTPLWTTSNDASSWARHPVKCGLDALSAAISVARTGKIFVVCAGEPGAGFQAKAVSTSVDGGRTWTLEKDCAIGTCGLLGAGYLGQIAVASSSTVFLVGGRSSVLVSHDSGQNWQAVKPLIGDSGGGTTQVRFFGSDGVVVGLDGAHDELPAIWHSSDGGAHWRVTLPVVG